MECSQLHEDELCPARSGSNSLLSIKGLIFSKVISLRISLKWRYNDIYQQWL